MENVILFQEQAPHNFINLIQFIKLVHVSSFIKLTFNIQVQNHQILNHISKNILNRYFYKTIFIILICIHNRVHEIAYGFRGHGPSEINVNPHSFSIAKYQSCVSS